MRRRLLALVSLTAVTLSAQQPAAIRLAPPSAVHPHEFTGITSVRELSDGRVIVTDGREQRLLVLDFSTGRSREIGRRGRGPMEYSMVSTVTPLRGDSSIMADFMVRRWLVFDRDSIVQTLPPDHPAVAATEGLFTASDALGRVARRVDRPIRDGVTFITERDSSALVVFDRVTGRADTVAMLRRNPRRRTQQTNADRRIISSSTADTELMPSGEDFVLFPDGALAVARLDPFRVDWRLPDGRWLYGDSLPIPKIPFDARERRAYDARIRPSQGAPPPMPAGIPAAPERIAPRFVPPFPYVGAVSRGPRGLLLVRREKSADFPEMTYLVIDRTSRLVGTFTLSNRERVEGASETALYISERDEDDLIRLRRHPWR
jgi:hypothetical protein